MQNSLLVYNPSNPPPTPTPSRHHLSRWIRFTKPWYKLIHRLNYLTTPDISNIDTPTKNRIAHALWAFQTRGGVGRGGQSTKQLILWIKVCCFSVYKISSGRITPYVSLFDKHCKSDFFSCLCRDFVYATYIWHHVDEERWVQFRDCIFPGAWFFCAELYLVGIQYI